MTNSAESVFQHIWMSLYARGIALVLLYGAAVHIGNIAGWTGTPWLSTPLLWRGLDIVLLLFNGAIALGLWRGTRWATWGLFGGMLLLQFMPYTLLRSRFISQPEDAQVLNSLLGTEAVLLGLFALLLWLDRHRSSM